MSKVSRVVFFTYPSVYSSLVLNVLLNAKHIEVVAVIASTRNLKAKENKLLSDLKRIKMSGIRYSLYLFMVTQAYKFLPKLFKEPSLEVTCDNHQIPIILTSDVNEAYTQDAIKQLNPDVIFCAHFNQLIKSDTYELATEAAINLHPSLLPDLKGVDPVFYALADSYSETGVTIHHLAEDFDTGAVIGQRAQKIIETDTLLSLNKKLFTHGAQLFVEYISGDKSIHIKTISNSSERYDSWPSRQKVSKFKQLRNFIYTPY